MTNAPDCGIILSVENISTNAGMAELADALDSGSSEGNFMQVQFLLPAPNMKKVLYSRGFFCFSDLIHRMKALTRFCAVFRVV